MVGRNGGSAGSSLRGEATDVQTRPLCACSHTSFSACAGGRGEGGKGGGKGGVKGGRELYIIHMISMTLHDIT